MKLVYIETKKPVHIGDEFQYRHHNAPAHAPSETLIVTEIMKPRHGGSTGRVYADKDGRNGCGGYYPSVYGMEWIEREDQTEDGLA